jgi:hypothetical protein
VRTVNALAETNPPRKTNAMVVMFAHMKNDMEGFESQVKRHVYSSPNMPHLCAVLATAKYPATIPQVVVAQKEQSRACSFGDYAVLLTMV